jgi:hypothetical protein
MIRKAALGTLLAGLIGVLVAGAIIFAVDRTENVEARGMGQGRAAGDRSGYEPQQTARNTVADVQASEQAGAVTSDTQVAQGAQSQSFGKGRGRGQQGSGQGGYGGSELGAPLIGGDLSESEVEALQMALEDEYKAWSVYEQVIADFGAVRPFTSIQRAEENHIAALVNLFEGYGLEVPANEWPGTVPTFDSLAEACEAGVQAEIDNAALYDQLFSMVDNPDLVRVFTALQRASQDQHLPAFELCAP